jgi:hypothetical protein
VTEQTALTDRTTTGPLSDPDNYVFALVFRVRELVMQALVTKDLAYLLGEELNFGETMYLFDLDEFEGYYPYGVVDGPPENHHSYQIMSMYDAAEVHQLLCLVMPEFPTVEFYVWASQDTVVPPGVGLNVRRDVQQGPHLNARCFDEDECHLVAERLWDLRKGKDGVHFERLPKNKYLVVNYPGTRRAYEHVMSHPNDAQGSANFYARRGYDVYILSHEEYHAFFGDGPDRVSKPVRPKTKLYPPNENKMVLTDGWPDGDYVAAFAAAQAQFPEVDFVIEQGLLYCVALDEDVATSVRAWVRHGPGVKLPEDDLPPPADVD